MKKIIISKLFLYRYRFIIGYILLGLAFIGLLLALPLFAQYGLSTGEMESATSSFNLSADAPLNGDLVDLPYRLLQKLSITLFGLTPYAIKLPSIIIGLFLGLLLILLLNRWFKNNISLLASCLVVLSTPFLFLAGSGTPLIMLVFWPTLLLWLGSKIQGENKPRPIYSFIFGIALLFSIFTPYMLYFAIFCVFFVFIQPHLRFIVKNLPRIPLIILGLFVLGGIATLTMNIINQPSTIMELLFAKNYEISSFFSNIGDGFSLVWSWRGLASGVFLAPLVGLPVFALVLIGLFSTARGFFASRNSIASLLIVFTVVITGFKPDSIVFLLLPISILTAHGLKYALEKWYGLFPENPYARVAAIIPLSVLFGVIIIPSLLQYIYGYRYNPNVVSEYNYDLITIRKNLTNETLLVPNNYDFYKILEHSSNIEVIDELPESPQIQKLAILRGRSEGSLYQLDKIITSPLSKDSDIIYLYTEKGE